MQAINTTENSNKWVNWINGAISNKLVKHYEYNHFDNVQEIGSGNFGKVFRANWKNYNGHFALKSFYDLNEVTIKEVVHEIQLLHEVDFHKNIIRFCGVTGNDFKSFHLVMEYADSGTLKDYLKENFESLTWNNKFNLAFQLVHAVSCLHNEGILHRDLNSNNILVHQNTIRLADLGLSKRIIELSNQSKLSGVIPYIDPKSFIRQRNKDGQIVIYSLNEKSDVYSVGVLLWEISSNRPPFENEPYDIGLATEISKGRREIPVLGSSIEYVKIYTDCWKSEPDDRPTINEVVDKLKSLNDHILNEVNSSEVKEKFIIIVDEIVDLLTKKKKGNEEKQSIIDYLNNNNITSQEIYNWLINNQNNSNSNSIVLLGEFYYLGIETKINEQKAFELYRNAAHLENMFGINNLGYCYQNGIGIGINERRAFTCYQKAADIGNILTAQNNLASMYENGKGVTKDIEQAIYWYRKSAEQGDQDARDKLEELFPNDASFEDTYTQKVRKRVRRSR